MSYIHFEHLSLGLLYIDILCFLTQLLNTSISTCEYAFS